MNQLRITNERESFQIEDESFGPLIVNGGSIFKKGLILGIQEKMVSGLLFYDKQNFYGYSEKYGICLLSPHFEYQQIEYDIEKNKLSPIQTNHSHDTFQNTDKNNIPIPLEIVFHDSMNYYIIIEEGINNVFELELFYDLNSIFPCIQLVFINKSPHTGKILFKNTNIYFKENMGMSEVLPNDVIQFHIEYVHEIFLVSISNFRKN